MSLALALVAAAAAAAPQMAEDEDIVVLAKRLDGITASVNYDAQGKLQCSMSRSTGLPRLDEAFCKTASQCVRKGAQTAAAIDACITARKPKMIEALRGAMKANRA